MDVKSSKGSSSLNKATADLNNAFKKLSSGLRINDASDDPAGLAVADSLKNQAVIYNRGAQNAVESSLGNNIAQSSLSQVSDISTRMAELATQSANGTLSDSQRLSLDQEYQGLKQEIDRIAATTSFNGQPLLQGGSGSSSQVGDSSDATSQISGTSVNLTALNQNSGSIASQAQALNAIEQVKGLSENVSAASGQIGAINNRLAVAEQNDRVAAENYKAAESRVRDVDMASAMAEKIGAEIRQNSSAALSAQANNLTKQVVMKLLS